MQPDLVSRAVASWAPAFDPCVIFTRAGLVPDAWQERALRSTSLSKIVLGSRQIGKGETCAALALHRALFRPPSVVVVISASARQSGEMYAGKLLRLYQPWAGDFPAVSQTQVELKLANGSRVISLPADEGRVRGIAGVGFIAIDEAAEVPDALYHAVRPMLATILDAELFVISTPKRRRGWFSGEWFEGKEWERFRVPATECGRIKPEFLARERHSLGDAVYKSQYECEFLNDEDTIDPKDLFIKPGTPLAAALERCSQPSGAPLPEAFDL